MLNHLYALSIKVRPFLKRMLVMFRHIVAAEPFLLENLQAAPNKHAFVCTKVLNMWKGSVDSKVLIEGEGRWVSFLTAKEKTK